MKEELEKYQPTWEMADFDCFIEYTVPDVQVIRSIMGDPEWLEVIKDQEEWVDTSRALVSLGYATTYLSEGKVVNMAK